MGPRSDDRGNGANITSIFNPKDASMGPRSDDRGNLKSAGTVTAEISLQWGRDQTIAEMPAAGGRAQVVFIASMGPRSDDRGNVASLASLRTRQRASMGPRSDDRGNFASSEKDRVMVLLQWGRDQTIAEMPAGNCTRSAVLSLQWGRDQTIAEMHPPATGTVEQAPASMGPRSDDRGNEVLNCCLGFYAWASMGPRSDDRGNSLASILFNFQRARTRFASASSHVSLFSLSLGNVTLPSPTFRETSPSRADAAFSVPPHRSQGHRVTKTG